MADSKGVKAAWSDFSGGLRRARSTLRSGRAQVRAMRAPLVATCVRVHPCAQLARRAMPRSRVHAAGLAVCARQAASEKADFLQGFHAAEADYRQRSTRTNRETKARGPPRRRAKARRATATAENGGGA